MGAADRIAEVILRQGEIAGRGAQNTGAIWGGALQNLGQQVAALPTYVQNQRMREQEVAMRNQEMQMRTSQMQEMQRKQAAEDALNNAYSKALGPDGNINMSLMASSIANTPAAGQWPLIQEHVAKAQQEGATYKKTLGEVADQQRTHMSAIANAAEAGGSDPETQAGLLLALVAQGDKAGTIAHDDAVGVISQLHGDDGSLNVAAVPQVIGRMKALSAGDVEKRAQARKADVEAANAGGKPQNLINVPPDTTVFDPVTRQPVYTAPPKITEPKPPTSEEDKAKAVTIRAKLLAKAPVSQEDRLWLQAHEAEATLTTDKSASFAAGRAATAAEGTNSRLDRTQAFQEAQAGRKELTDKVEQPYLDAKEKAATLRSVIEAAKGGNMAAGNVQSLLATLGLVTMEGVKRINTTELESVQGAGSLLERIKGEIGGITAGKPLSPKIQQDLTQMATLLEQSARTKYEQGFKQITGRYGLKDEQLLPSEVPTSTSPAGGVPTYQDYLKAKQGKK